MTPHAKAIDLFNEYYSYLKANLMYDEEAREDAKQCALIAIDEIIKVACDYSDYDETVTKEYWEKVKIEINKL
jgi:hypothetical protein